MNSCATVAHKRRNTLLPSTDVHTHAAVGGAPNCIHRQECELDVIVGRDHDSRWTIYDFVIKDWVVGLLEIRDPKRRHICRNERGACTGRRAHSGSGFHRCASDVAPCGTGFRVARVTLPPARATKPIARIDLPLAGIDLPLAGVDLPVAGVDLRMRQSTCQMRQSMCGVRESVRRLHAVR